MYNTQLNDIGQYSKLQPLSIFMLQFAIINLAKICKYKHRQLKKQKWA